MIRLLFTGIFLLVFFIFSVPYFIFLWLVGKKSKYTHDILGYKVVIWAFKVVLFISGADVLVKGKENIPTDTSVLYVGNHRGFFDIVIGYINVLPLTGFVSKKEIKKVPILGHWMTIMNCLLLDRENIKEGLKTILIGIEKLKNGISIFIFPEGTRGKDDNSVMEFKEGSLKLAEKSKKPIVPVAFNNTSGIFEDHFPFIRKAKVIVEFGKPIYLEELSKEDKKRIGAYTHDIVEKMVQKNKEEL